MPRKQQQYSTAAAGIRLRHYESTAKTEKNGYALKQCLGEGLVGGGAYYCCYYYYFYYYYYHYYYY